MSPEAAPARLGRGSLALLLAAAAVLAVPVVITPFPIDQQVAFAIALGLVALVVSRFRGPWVAPALIALSLSVSTRYIFWRISHTSDFTWGADAAAGMLLLLSELYSFLILSLGYVQSIGPLDRKPVPLPPNPDDWPTLDIYIPTYNEPIEVVRDTVFAARNMDWPADKMKVWILDDGHRASFRSFANAVGVGYLDRDDNQHAKAGNLNRALERTRGEYIAIFDCDHVPTRSFLQVAMGWFLKDPKLALMQLPHHFYSPDPFERNLRTFRSVPNEGELFYGLLQQGNDLWGAAFFCGSCAVIRREAVDSIGGFAVNTVTEDAHTALKMHRKGWHSAYIDIPQAAGLATESLSVHVGQRIRWARGMVQIFRTENPLLSSGLKLSQRLCYTSAMLYFLFALPRLVFLLSPLAFLFFELHIFNAAPTLVLAYALPHLAHSVITNSHIQGRFRHSFWAEVYETALAPYILLPTWLALINPSLGKFNVTQKGGLVENEHFDRHIAIPYLVLLALNVAGLAFGIYRVAVGLNDLDVVGINLAWTAYNLIVVGGTVAVAFERRQVRKSWRIDARIPVVVRTAEGQTLSGHTQDLSQGGLAMSLTDAVELPVNSLVTVSLALEDELLPVPVRVVGGRGRSVRGHFEQLTLEEQEWVARAIFGRPDAWVDWHSDNEDKPMRAGAQIVRVAAGAIGRLLRRPSTFLAKG